MKFSLFSLVDLFSSLPKKENGRKKKLDSTKSLSSPALANLQSHRPRITFFWSSFNVLSSRKTNRTRSHTSPSHTSSSDTLQSQSCINKLGSSLMCSKFSYLYFLKIFCKLLPLITQLIILIVSLLYHNYTFALFAGLGFGVTLSYHINHGIDTYLRKRSSFKKNAAQNVTSFSSETLLSESKNSQHSHLLLLLKKMPSITLPLLNNAIFLKSHSSASNEYNENNQCTADRLSSSFSLDIFSLLQSSSSSYYPSILWKQSLYFWINQWKLSCKDSHNHNLSSYISTSLNSLRVMSGIYPLKASYVDTEKNRDKNKASHKISTREEEFTILPLYIDLINDGPHALIGGTTGSGKSIFLQSWCSAMALHYSPLHLNFIFLDFKGGSTFTNLSQLPHVVGTVSDLNLGHAKRAFRAIEAELIKREHLISQYKVQQIGELPFIVARLVIVIDEFQALKSLLPDFHERLHRIAAQGRSLGIHLILSTQSPGFQVNSEMRANFNLRICFRVQEKIQSSELIGSPSAAYIPHEFPGSGYIKFNDRLHIFKSTTCDPDTIVSSIKTCTNFGTSLVLSQVPLPPPSYSNIHIVKKEKNIANRRTNLLSLFCKKPSSLFSSTLQRTIPLTLSVYEKKKIRLSHCIPLGIVDSGITLETYYLPLNKGNIAIIGGNGRGKTHIFLLVKYYLSHFLDIDFTEEFSLCEASLSSPDFRSSPLVTPASYNTDLPYTSHTFSSQESLPFSANKPDTIHKRTRLLLCDDSDSYFDPLNDTKEKHYFHSVFKQGRCLFSTRGAPSLKYLENCFAKIIFPCGDPSIDGLNGISQNALRDWETRDFTTAGRALLYDKSGPKTIQVFSPPQV